MGLDMYAFTTDDYLGQAVDFDAGLATERIHYWREHADLHGWMEQLYRAKGGRDKQFNRVNVQLTESDLQQLEADVRAQRLPETQGFSDGSELPDDLAFIAKARTALADKLTVFYTSWW